MRLNVKMSQNRKQMPDQAKLGFGAHFTDHIFIMEYNSERGWHRPRIEPYGPLTLDPATMVFHYAQCVFEGLKAYRREDGEIQLFRPRQNLKRLNRSCRRMCIPEIDEEFILDVTKELIRIDMRWVPSEPATALYVRPTIIATDPFLGLRASDTYLFYIILSPVGAYYPEGFNPVKIWVTDEYVRAVRGGVGEAKTGGNYAASIYAGNLAREKGYAQVLWLDGVQRRYVEEVGAMNIFFVIDDELITPALNGSILPGITRDSVLELARSWGRRTTERAISIDEVIDAAESGNLQESFGSGTAAVISPVGEIGFRKKSVTINDGRGGPLARKLYQALTDIHYGRSAGPVGWVEPV